MRNVSKRLKDFLDFVEECDRGYSSNLAAQRHEEAKLQDFLHNIEFETSYSKRNKMCTKLHESRSKRREFKDAVEEYEEIAKFFQDPIHRKTLNQLSQLLGKIRKVERYHADRVYIPRVLDKEENN